MVPGAFCLLNERINFLLDGEDLRCRNVGVDVLRDVSVGVSEQLLRVLDIDAGFVEQSGVAVSELMSGQVKTGLFLPMLPGT